MMTDDSTERRGEGAGRDPAGQGAVLRRLLRARNTSRVDAGEAPGMPQTSPQTPARGAATAVGRAAERLYGLPVRPLSVVPGAVTLAELPEILPDPALLAVVTGPGEAVGVVALDPAIVTTLIEVQALGRMTARPVERRRLTRSDAMLCAEFVNVLLAELQSEVSGLEGYENYAGFRFLSHLDDHRPLMLMLEDGGLRSLRLTLVMGAEGARREGRIVVALPQARVPSERGLPAPRPMIMGAPLALPGVDRVADARPAAPPAAPVRAPGGPDSLTAAMQTAPVELVGVLCRRKVSLGELRNLRPGKLLSLPRVSLYDARIETRTGQVLAHGKLGEADGCHAIRLHDPAAARRDDEAWEAEAKAALAAIGGHRPAMDAPEPALADLGQPDAFRMNMGLGMGMGLGDLPSTG